MGWGDLPDWNDGKPVLNSFGEPTDAEKMMARYFHFYAREDDRPEPIPSFIARVVEA